MRWSGSRCTTRSCSRRPGAMSRTGPRRYRLRGSTWPVLAETSSPEAAREVRAAPAWQALAGALTERARRVHQVAARNVRRVGDVDKTRPGLFLFNYFAGDDPALAVAVWDYLAGWYEAETGLDNSPLLQP